MQVDGNENVFQEVNVYRPEPHEPNPYKSAFYVKPTTFKTELEAQRVINPFTARAWKVVNLKSKNRVGTTSGWKIVPLNSAPAFALDDSKIIQRAGFLKKNILVTPYHPEYVIVLQFCLLCSARNCLLETMCMRKRLMMDLPSGPKPTVTSTTPTLLSGTSSVPLMLLVVRIGLSCQLSMLVSPSSQTTSLISVQLWMFLQLLPKWNAALNQELNCKALSPHPTNLVTLSI